IPGAKHTPGRMNVFTIGELEIMVDYAHNPDGFRQMEKFLQSMPDRKKFGIVTSPGDRRDEDIIQVGMHSARMFDEIIIRHDKDLRGRTKDEIMDLIKKGICKVNPGIRVHIVSDEKDAIL